MKNLILTLLLIPTLFASVHAQSLTSAEAVINKYINAIGGKKALMQIKDMTSVGSLVSNNTKMKITLKRKAPAKASTVITGDKGKLLYKNIIDGTNVVDITQQGTVRQSKQAARLSLMYNRMFPELVYKEEGIKSTLEGKMQIAGRDAYKVTSTFADGSPLWTDYYDVVTGLKVQNVIKWDQKRIATLDLSDYRVVNGVKLPFTTVYQEKGGVASKTKTSSVVVNKGINDTDFVHN